MSLYSLDNPRTPYVNQASIGLSEIHLPLPFECWDLRRAPPLLPPPPPPGVREEMLTQETSNIRFLQQLLSKAEPLSLPSAHWRYLAKGEREGGLSFFQARREFPWAGVMPLEKEALRLGSASLFLSCLFSFLHFLVVKRCELWVFEISERFVLSLSRVKMATDPERTEMVAAAQL